MPKPHSPVTPSQVDKFRDLARQIGADESEAAFKAKLVKIAKTPRAVTSHPAKPAKGD
jgi:hypothetical protein